MKIYVGVDSANPEASEACAKSAARFIGWNSVRFVETKKLRESGSYWRIHNGTESTDFTYSRFLVPWLSGNRGQSLFCDGDFLWRKDPYLILDHVNNKDAVMVVKHQITADMLSATKMNGKVQKWYPKKNWSSLMVFNNDHRDCNKLSPAVVSIAPPVYLHGFEWTTSKNIGSIPLTFNHLVGYYDNQDPVAVHFTDGGPWLEGYRDVPFADEWRECVQSCIE